MVARVQAKDEYGTQFQNFDLKCTGTSGFSVYVWKCKRLCIRQGYSFAGGYHKVFIVKDKVSISAISVAIKRIAA